MTVIQLKRFLKETRKIKGYSKLNKAKLIQTAKNGSLSSSSTSKTPPPLKSWKDLLTSLDVNAHTKDSNLYRRVLPDDSLLSNMIKCNTKNPVPGSVRMPYWKPWVCVSFAAKDLQGSGVGCDDVDDSNAGREPWGLCDYIRDFMVWPQDFMYIDAEQVGW